MGFGIVGDLVAHARLENEAAAVFEFGMQFSAQAQQHMPFAAPMIGKIPGVYVTRRTRMSPKFCVRHVAAPVIPGCSVGSMASQSVTVNVGVESNISSTVTDGCTRAKVVWRKWRESLEGWRSASSKEVTSREDRLLAVLGGGRRRSGSSGRECPHR